MGTAYVFSFGRMKRLWKLLTVLWQWKNGSFQDPIFGLVAAGNGWRVRDEYEASKKQSRRLWEWYLDMCGFNPNSPIRQHIHRVCKRDLGTHIRGLFFEAFEGKPTLQDIYQISKFLEGKIHALNKATAHTSLSTLDAKEKIFMKEHMRDLFPGSDLEDFGLFTAWVELIIVRRLLKTVIFTVSSQSILHGIAFLKDGLSVNLVVNISLTVRGHNGSPYSMRLHTVTPRSKGKLSFIEEGSGEILEEGEEEEEELGY